MKSALFRMTVLAAAVGAALPAYAVDGYDTSGDNARSQALQANYLSLKDDFNVWMNPAYVGEYSGRAYVNSHAVPGGDIAMGGANVKLGPGTLGVYLGRDYSNGDLVTNANGTGAFAGTGVGITTNITTPNNRFDVLYGMHVGGMKAGGRFNWNSQSKKVTVGTTVYELSERDINISGGIAMDSMPLDVAFTYGIPSFSTTVTAPGATDSIKDHDAGSLGLVGRFEAMKGRSSSLLLAAAYLSDSPNVVRANSAATTDLYDIDNTTYVLSATYGIAPSSNQEFAVGTEFRNLKATTDTKIGAGAVTHTEVVTKTLPINLGYEIKGLGESQKWTLRGSMAKNLYKSVINKLGGTENYDTGALAWGIGMGYAVGKSLTIDAAMSQGDLFAGTAMLSAGATGQLITRLTVNYVM